MDAETGPDADAPRPCGLALLLCMMDRSKDTAESALVGYASRLQVRGILFDEDFHWARDLSSEISGFWAKAIPIRRLLSGTLRMMACGGNGNLSRRAVSLLCGFPCPSSCPPVRHTPGVGNPSNVRGEMGQTCRDV